MKLKTRLTALFLGLLLAVPATAQVGNSFDLGDIIGIGNNGGYNRGGIDTGAVLGIANILYQVTQRNRNDGYYPNNGGYYPNNGGYYPGNGGYYPNNGGYYPGNGGYYPNNGGYYPNNGGYYPGNGGYYPGNNGRW